MLKTSLKKWFILTSVVVITSTYHLLQHITKQRDKMFSNTHNVKWRYKYNSFYPATNQRRLVWIKNSLTISATNCPGRQTNLDSSIQIFDITEGQIDSAPKTRWITTKYGKYYWHCWSIGLLQTGLLHYMSVILVATR